MHLGTTEIILIVVLALVRMKRSPKKTKKKRIRKAAGIV